MIIKQHQLNSDSNQSSVLIFPKVKIFIALLLLVFSFNRLVAQTGTVSGIVLDGDSKSGLPGASVIIKGTTQGAITDLDGKFLISAIKPGSINLQISYMGYVTQTTDNLIIANSDNKHINVTLKQNINLLNGADVVAVRKTHTDNAVLMEVKQSAQIVNGVSNQQITRSQDRSASEVVKRIPGVTVLNNGFVVIRGLSERYNTTLLNGILAPSMEADKKAFTLDVIPSSMLDRLLIYKTGSPELPGEFAGGIIKIVTRNVSDENSLSVSYSTGIRDHTTFRQFYQAPKGNADWMGKDDGTRGLPGSFPESLYNLSASELADLGKKLPNAWTPAQTKASPDQRFSATLIENVKIGKIKAGNITTIQYSNTFESNQSENYGFNSFNPQLGFSDSTYAYNDGEYKENVRLSLIHNWSFIVSPRTKIEFRNFFNQQGSNQAIIRSGVSYEEGNLVKAYAFRYQQRTLYSGQLSGSHDLNANRSKLEWTTGYSYSNSAEPDFRRIRTKKGISNSDSSIPYQVIIPSSASTLDAGRFYSDLKEHVETFALDFQHTLGSSSNSKAPKLKAGFYGETKQREFNARWMSYKISRLEQFDESLLNLPLDQIFAAENINDSTGFKLEEGTNPNDKYSAGGLLAAGYVGLSWPMSDNINVSGGLRTEYSNQILESRTYGNKKVEVDNKVLSLLPSINASYSFNQEMLIRVAYSRTVNRPEFRELAPFSYYDFTFNTVLEGNDALKSARIDNYDLRWEWYPSLGELISLGVFYKNFIDPIEMFYKPGSGTRNFTFMNAEGATSLGVELEIKKSFNSIIDTSRSNGNSFFKRMLARTGVLLNGALIKSTINLGYKAVGQNQNRPMMGQSPYIINAGLFFNDIKSNLQFSAMYNVIGKRIYAVGTFGSSDLYFLPRNCLDLTITKGFGKHLEVKAGIQDLFAEDEIYQLDSNENGKMDGQDDKALIVHKGSYYSLGINIKL